jgi:transcriptional regulator with XRE-family HTH domain
MESTQASLLRPRTDDLAITLAILRIIRRWSQSELAEAAGVTNSAISDYERGKVDPQTQTLRKLIGALGLPFSALDHTQAFIQTIQAQMSADDAPVLAAGEQIFSAAGVSPALRARRVEIAQAASDAGRCASRLVQLLLEGPLGGLPETP